MGSSQSRTDDGFDSGKSIRRRLGILAEQLGIETGWHQ